jgi:predicted transcriptional regulator of viral defense system
MTINQWINDREQRGSSTFSFNDVIAAFPSIDSQQIKNALYRLTIHKSIISVYKGFYVIIPPQYALKGIVPPPYYVNQLMRYIGKPYYVGLLNAAEIFGAAHQRPQLYSIMTIPPKTTTSIKKNSIIRWFYTIRFPEEFLITRNSETSTVKYSSAELTALDLVQYAYHIGGLSRAATVLAELCEVTNFEKLNNHIFNYVKVSTFQRLGFILDEILEETAQAEALYKFDIKVKTVQDHGGSFWRHSKYTYTINPDSIGLKWYYPRANGLQKDCAIGKWNIETASLEKYIEIYERDVTETVKETFTEVTSYTDNFKSSAELGKSEKDGITWKVGLGYDISKTKTGTSTIEVTKQEGDDQLGTLSENFYQPIIIEQKGNEYRLHNISNGAVSVTILPLRYNATRTVLTRCAHL